MLITKQGIIRDHSSCCWSSQFDARSCDLNIQLVSSDTRLRFEMQGKRKQTERWWSQEEGYEAEAKKLGMWKARAYPTPCPGRSISTLSQSQHHLPLGFIRCLSFLGYTMHSKLSFSNPFFALLQFSKTLTQNHNSWWWWWWWWQTSLNFVSGDIFPNSNMSQASYHDISLTFPFWNPKNKPQQMIITNTLKCTVS